MSNSDRVLCKFFAHGACLKGENCEYAHDWTAPPNNICKYYQQGACAYGARCRYDHVKPVKVFRAESPASSSSAASVVTTIDRSPVYSVQKELSSTATSRLLPSRSKQAWILQLEDPDTSNDDVFPKPRGHDPDGQVLCSFAAAGHCPKGDKCPHVHGDLCLSCGKHCLHPARPKEREEHSKTCAKMQKHLESLRRSQEIECSVCLERVLLKPKEKDRRFGILCECDHPFCISCIRVWRGSSPSSGMDINSTLRACPICRKLSYFVIPSVIWYFSQEEKEDIVNSYKGKLKSIDCKHFDFGNGSCPFGISCFYKVRQPFLLFSLALFCFFLGMYDCSIFGVCLSLLQSLAFILVCVCVFFFFFFFFVFLHESMLFILLYQGCFTLFLGLVVCILVLLAGPSYMYLSAQLSMLKRCVNLSQMFFL